MKSLHPKFFPRFTGQQAKTLSGFYSMECHRNGTSWFTPQAGSSFRVNVRTDRVYPLQKLQYASFPFSMLPDFCSTRWSSVGW
ncbi:MAG: hypothetical protein K0B15_00670 [Lentimicrobium sp.]|nr:hypothetical protein [Lentimicrobium sp.]